MQRKRRICSYRRVSSTEASSRVPRARDVSVEKSAPHVADKAGFGDATPRLVGDHAAAAVTGSAT